MGENEYNPPLDWETTKLDILISSELQDLYDELCDKEGTKS